MNDGLEILVDDSPQDRQSAQVEFDYLLLELDTLILQYRAGRAEQPLADLATKLHAVDRYVNRYAGWLFERDAAAPLGDTLTQTLARRNWVCQRLAAQCLRLYRWLMEARERCVLTEQARDQALAMAREAYQANDRLGVLVALYADALRYHGIAVPEVTEVAHGEGE